MRAYLVLAIVSVATAAPTEDARDVKFLEESLRTKKSPGYGIGGPSYGLPSVAAAPCAGGPSLAPVTFFAVAPHAAAVPALHYRENEHMGHQARAEEHGRSYYDSSVASAAIASAAASAAASAGAGAAATGPAVGLFPNAKVGGCAVPLLLSCAPSVVSGHLAHAHQASYAAPSAASFGASSAASLAAALAPPAYRAPENNNMEHRNVDSEKATTMISEQNTPQFSEHTLPENHHQMMSMKPMTKRAI